MQNFGMLKQVVHMEPLGFKELRISAGPIPSKIDWVANVRIISQTPLSNCCPKAQKFNVISDMYRAVSRTLRGE
jgi:hypothetical protein